MKNLLIFIAYLTIIDTSPAKNFPSFIGLYNGQVKTWGKDVLIGRWNGVFKNGGIFTTESSTIKFRKGGVMVFRRVLIRLTGRYRIDGDIIRFSAHKDGISVRGHIHPSSRYFFLLIHQRYIVLTKVDVDFTPTPTPTPAPTP